jgi:hypothetical protein
MIADNRKDVRHEFSVLLMNAIPEAIIFSGDIADFGGQSPVIVISGAGSNREQITPYDYQPSHHLNVFVFVLYKDEAAEWDELDAEDLLDDLEHKIFEVIRTNQKGNAWDSITYTTASSASPAPASIGGAEYKIEVIPLSFS